MNEGKGGVMETYFTTKELSEYLKIAEQTIRRWIMNNEIYYVRIHNVIRFRLSEVEAWIDENRDKLPWMEKGGKERDLFNETEEIPIGEVEGSHIVTGEVDGLWNCSPGKNGEGVTHD